MSGGDFQARVRELFHAALPLAPEERAELLANRCHDPAVRAEVESLLAAHDDSGPFLERSVWELAGEKTFAGSGIGPYRITGTLGSGGMGSVFLCVREGDQFIQRVAVKLVRGGAAGQALVERFRQERRILAALEHPNIARLLDGGTTDDGVPYLVMEYVEGEPVDDWCRERRSTPAEKIRLFLQLCDAVQYAHRNLVIHRDIKPANVLVNADGVPKLLDFGIAKLVLPEARPDATATRIMTPDYASPEQLRGEAVSTASDVYSLGVLLYELLTGGKPFPSGGRTPAGAAPRASTRDRTLRGDLDTILATALESEPAARYGSVDRLADDLRRYLAGRPIHARPATFRYRASKFVRRNRLPVAAAVVVVVVAAVAFATTLHQKRIAERRFEQVRAIARSVVFEIHDAIATLRGSTPARELLVRRALGYLDALAAEASGNAALQTELAGAYLKIGDVQGLPYAPNLGDTSGAISSYRKGLSIAAALEDDPAVLALRADLHDRLGLVQQRALRWREALGQHESALAIRRRQAVSPARQVALARTWTAIGDCRYVGSSQLRPDERKPPTTAYRMALQALASVPAAGPQGPDRLVETARAHQRLGGWYSNPTHRDLPLAIRHHDAALAALARRAALEPSNAQARRNWADQMVMKATAQNRMDDAAGALAGTNEALRILEELRRADPDNAEARRDLSFAHQERASALILLGRLEEAQASASQALAIQERMAGESPDNREDRRGLATIYGLIRRIHLARGETQEAERWNAKARAVVDDLARSTAQ